jgi:hypothetical protein
MPLKPWEIDRRTGAQGPTTQRRIPVRPPTQTQPYTSRPPTDAAYGDHFDFQAEVRAGDQQDQQFDLASLLGSGGGSGGRRYGGGGGGGGVGLGEQREWAGSQIDFLKQMLSGGRFAPQTRPYERNTTLTDRLGSAVSADRQAASGAYDALDAFLARQNSTPNAFEGVQRQSGAVGDAFNTLLDVLGANQNQAREGRTATSQFGRADADRNIASQQVAGNTAIDLREDARREQVENQNFASSQAARQAQNQVLMQIAEIAAAVGADIPALAEIGLN